MTEKKHLSKADATEIFIRNVVFVRSVAFRNAPASDLVEDIIHDAYIVFVEKAEKWEYDPERVRALLRKIVENVAARHWKTWIRNLPEKLLAIAELLVSNQGESEILSTMDKMDEKVCALRTCIQKLGSAQRQLLEMYYFEDVAYSTLSETTGKSVDSLYMQMSRIRTILHDCVEKTVQWELDDDQ